MDLPQGYSLHVIVVCRLIKSIYDLKQDAIEWFDKLGEILFFLGFHQTKGDSFSVCFQNTNYFCSYPSIC